MLFSARLREGSWDISLSKGSAVLFEKEPQKLWHYWVIWKRPRSLNFLYSKFQQKNFCAQQENKWPKIQIQMNWKWASANQASSRKFMCTCLSATEPVWRQICLCVCFYQPTLCALLNSYQYVLCVSRYESAQWHKGSIREKWGNDRQSWKWLLQSRLQAGFRH